MWLAFLGRKLPRTVAVDTLMYYTTNACFPASARLKKWPALPPAAYAPRTLSALGELASCKTLANIRTQGARQNNAKLCRTAGSGLEEARMRPLEAAPMRGMNL